VSKPVCEEGLTLVEAEQLHVRYSIVFLFGIGVTLAWQSYGQEAKEMVRTQAPSLAWLLPVSNTKAPPDDQGSMTAAASSPQVERLELSLFVMRRSVEQIALIDRLQGRNLGQLILFGGELVLLGGDLLYQIPTSAPGRSPTQTAATHWAVIGQTQWERSFTWR
jgi:hypothetical protein